MSVAPLQFLLLVFAGWVNRRQLEIVEYLQEENRVLREQLGDRRLRFTDAQRRRLADEGQSARPPHPGNSSPSGGARHDPALYRELVAKKYDAPPDEHAGDPVRTTSLQRLVVQFATENPRAGATPDPWRAPQPRSRARTETPSSASSPSMAWNRHPSAARRCHGNLPQGALRSESRRPTSSPSRSSRSAVSSATSSGSSSTSSPRRVHIAGLVRHPHDAWIQQIARNLTDSVDGFLRGKRYLIHDRDPLFTDAFPRGPPRRRHRVPQAASPKP